MKFNGKVKSSREIKRQKWRGKVGGREEEFFIFYFFIRIGRWKVQIFNFNNYLKLERKEWKVEINLSSWI